MLEISPAEILNMKAQVSIPSSCPALILLGVEYVILGWYLAAHHIFWLIGTFILGLTFAVIWKKNPILNAFEWLVQQQVIVVIGISFLLSLLLAWVYLKPVLLELSLLPLLTLVYALLEMRTAEFKQSDVLLWAALVTGLGLGLGETIDLFVIPSMRY